MPERSSFNERLHYRLDSFLARGSGALFLALLLGFLGALLCLATLRLLLNVIDPDLEKDAARHVWTIFLELTDPGNMGEDTETPSVFKLSAVLTGITGVVIFSALIAFLTTGLDQALGHLRKGHSRVLESGHTLILGWTPRVVEILRELVEANESESDPVVVILADDDKEEMDEYLRTHFPDRQNTRIVTRSGATSSLLNLDRVNAGAAKSAIVLADCDSAATEEAKNASDAKVVKTVLAIEAHLAQDREFSIVAEVFAKRNRQVVRDVAPTRVSVVDVDEILAKIMVQTSRTSGLSVVYAELLSFIGAEMYFHGADWGGLPFGQVLYHFADGVPMGVRHADGKLTIRPPADYAMQAGDEVLIVANDDSSIAFQAQAVMTPEPRDIPDLRVQRQRERKLILGWSQKAPIVIAEYADYVLDGSEIDVMVHEPTEEVRASVAALNAELGSIQVRLIEKDPLVSEDLLSVDPFSYNDVTILPQRLGADPDPERIDSETIVVLLHLRKRVRELREQGVKITTKLITEVLDSSNQELVAQAGVDDFIISNRMVSMMFAQLSEEPEIKAVYDDLFQEEGSEIYVKPAWLYFHQLPVTCRFGDVMHAAQKRDGEICIGYKLEEHAHDSQNNYGVKLIPPKDAEIRLTALDALVVVAEDDR